MSKVDWSLAPSWADRVILGPLTNFKYWASEGRRVQFGGDYDLADDFHISEGWELVEMKAESWCGPEDGLPPIGTYVQVHDKECELAYGAGEEGFIIAQVENTAVVRMSYGLGCFTAKHLRTPEQLAAEERERAVNDLASEISGYFNQEDPETKHDKLAKYLLDQGFKREGK